MATNIPTRRTTRTTRTATQKEAENATARPSRITSSRAKPPSNSAASTANGAGNFTRATAASRAKSTGGETKDKMDAAAHKRKREALGEVAGPTTNHKSKAAKEKEGGKGRVAESAQPLREKSADGVLLKAKVTTTTTTTKRQPLGTVAGGETRKQSRSTVVVHRPLEEVKEETHDEDAMAVDHHPAEVETRRISSRRSATQTQVVKPEPAPAHAERRSLSTRVIAVEDEAEEHRVFKKRRTSSEAPDSEAPAASGTDEAEVQRELFEYVEPEADPNGEEWTDLDSEDKDDPLMVSEYVTDIFNYMKEIELTTMPNPNYMESQKELAWKMRGILMDWLVQVQVRFRLQPETLFLAVNTIDRFLSARVVSLAKLQLVGITCMFLASKIEEVVAPSCESFRMIADDTYSDEEIMQAERYVLRTLEWNMSYPNPMHFLRRVSKADEYDVQSRTIAKYLLEIPLLEWRFLCTPPSLTAAAAIWLARLVLGRVEWTPNLAHYSSYRESALVPTASLMLTYVLKPKAKRHQSFFNKYASKRYMKASVFMREWALQYWEEGSQVDLSENLPLFKARIVRQAEAERERREAEEAEYAEALEASALGAERTIRA